jgi:hypothetical protein
VVAHAHAHHGAGRLALAARGDDDDFMTRQRFHLAGGQQLLFLDVQIAEFDGDAHIVDHAAPDHPDAAPMSPRHIDHLLDASQVGGKGRQQHAARRFRHHGVQGGLERGFAVGAAPTFSIGAVGQQQQHAFIAPLAQLFLFGGAAIDRRRVEAVVAGVDDATGGRQYGDADAVWETVRRVEKLYGEGRQFDDIIRGDRAQIGFAQQLLLAQFDFEQPLRQRRGIDRRAQPLLHKV